MLLSDATGAPNCAGGQRPEQSQATEWKIGVLAIAGRQRLGNLEKKSQITTGESKSSPSSGMACPPFCTEYKMTAGVPSLTQVMLSTEVRPPLCGSVAICGGAVMPSSFAQYFAVSSLESTLPSFAPPKFTMPPRKGLIGSAVPLTIITGIGLSVWPQSRFSFTGTLAEIAA